MSVEFDDDFRENYLNNLGNLVVDHAASNSSKGRKGGDEKVIHFNLAPLMSQNEINEVGCDWNDLESIKRFIRHREEKLKKEVSAEFKI
ncbi:hypothetical protein [Pseudomonas hygromyciniae]|uniref:hypothetical protein n=1 Tax=Pseudomonas hygromyciniae TaxID=2812000 RepID=UPI001F080177|nr:hypothetical protein [Pseudomonas hygromyciniae]